MGRAHLKSRADGVLVCAFCSLIVLQILVSLNEKSLTFDEGNRFLSGYQYITQGDFRLNQEHPPLVKYLVGLPLLFMNVKLPPETGRWQGVDQQWQLGHDFLYRYNDAESIIWRSRLAVLPLTLLLAVFVYLWARNLFGRGAGLFALFLFSFEPNILAHGGLVNTDLGLACFVFLTVFGFARLSHRITFPWVLFTGLSFGLALCTKFTSLWLIPVLTTLGLVRALSHGQMMLAIPGRSEQVLVSQRARAGVVALVLVSIGLTGYLTLWGAYQFRYWTAEPRDPLVTAHLDRISPKTAPLREIFSVAREYQLLPEAYLFGVARVLELKDRTSFLFGEKGSGWWYYFFATFFLKTPLPLIFLVILGLIGALPALRNTRAGLLPLLMTPAVYFGIASMSYLNIGHRHILIIYPFLFVVASAVVPWVRCRGRVWQGLVGAASVWYVIASVSVFPHYLAYFNELVGGPDRGHAYLLDSNLDWGQDLKGLKKYMDRNGIDRVWLSYFGTADPTYYGIDYNDLPGSFDFTPGYTRYSGPARFLAVSATNLYSVYQPLDWALLRGREPVAKIGYSIFIYDFGRPVEIRARRESSQQ